MGLSGDLARLNEIASALDRAPMAIRNRVAVAMTHAANELLEEEFSAGMDPDGQAWEPLAASTIARGRGNPPLGGTSVERDVRAVRVGTKVAINSSERAGYHQRGHAKPTRLPRRPMWPEGQMPERWELSLSLAANGAILDALGASGLKAAE
jgi:hypothetical protein